MATFPEITPAPVLNDLIERQQQVTTISVVASSTPSGVNNGSSTTEKKGFPVAVAIPALVGGMAAAFGAFGLWWWCTKRNKRQRRERWEAAQKKKQRQRANSAGRPSISSSRQPSATNLKNMAEKDIIPPVPALPKHYPPAPQPQSGRGGEKQQSHAYGYAPQSQSHGQEYGVYGHADPYSYPQDQHQYQAPVAQYPGYAMQPSIDGPISPTYSDHSSASGSGSGSGSTATSDTPVEKPKKTSPTKSGSRSTARVAVADSAAATAGLDASVRYQPKKPSPLALKAQQEKDALNARIAGAAGRPVSGYADQPQETLANPDEYNANTQYLSANQTSGRNVVSGEWGVALGSPNHDPASTFSFADQQQQSLDQVQGQGRGQQRYSNDPYLSSAQQTRAPSGLYTNDPYAGYHDPVGNGKKSNWV